MIRACRTRTLSGTVVIVSGTTGARAIRVMVVDDSAVVREVVQQVLKKHPDIQVIGTAQDPIFALQRMQNAWPDVILLDIEMPRMDGLTFLRHIMKEHPTPTVPGTPPFVRGVVHVRDRVIPVVDLAIKLRLEPKPVTKRTCILMLDLELESRRFPVGIVMDGIATLLDVDTKQIRHTPRFGSNIEVVYLSGLIPTERGMLPLLDPQRVFASDELSQVELSTRSAGASSEPA